MLFQSTHPSGVRLHASGRPHRRELISIHAPQWGATVDSRRFRVQYGRFQSTHPSGVRHEAGEVVVLGGGISIHAPQWGATKYPKAFVKVALDFNPRTPVGCDGGSETVDSGRDEFQSTHPSGVRPIATIDSTVQAVFQSTHPSGVRLAAYGAEGKDYYIFQSTHPSGVRLLHICRPVSVWVFQSTHPSGVRPR